MLIYHSTRPRSSYEEYHATFFSSSSTSFTNGNQASALISYETHYSAGGSTTGKTEIFWAITANTGLTHVSSQIAVTHSEAGPTSSSMVQSLNVTNSLINSSGGTGNSGFATSVSASGTNILSTVVSTSTTRTSVITRTTTHSTSTSTTKYTVTGIGTNAHLAVTTGTTNAITSHTVTQSTVLTTTTSRSLTASVGIETGLVIDARDRWAWAFTETSSVASPKFLSELATSFSTTVLWGITTAGAVAYAALPETSFIASTFTSPDARSTITYDQITDNGTSNATFTIGNNFSRDTTELEVVIYTTSSTTSTVGTLSSFLTGYTTTSTTKTVISYETFTGYTMIDGKELTMRSFRLFQTTSSAMILLEAYNAAGSSTAFHASSSSSQERTTVGKIGMQFLAYNDPNTYVQPVPPQGFAAPQELRSTATHGFGTNLTFNGTTVFYPRTASLLPGVIVPYPVNHSAQNTDSHTWSYSWSFDSSGATLYFSEMSTYLAGTKTSTSSTVSSGTFSTGAQTGDFVAMDGTVFGGYQAIKSMAETAYYPPRAVRGTSIGTNGGTTTYQSVFTAGTSATLKETMVVEMSMRAYRPVIAIVSAATPAFSTLLRNPDT